MPRCCPLSWTSSRSPLFWPRPGSDTFPPPGLTQQGRLHSNRPSQFRGHLDSDSVLSMYSAAPQVWRWGSRSGESPEDNPWTKGFSDTSKLPQDLKDG